MNIDPMSALAFEGAVKVAQDERKKHETLGCSYPNCSNYKPSTVQGTARYCCTGCHMDHLDYIEFDELGVIIPLMFEDEAARWLDRAIHDGWKREYCETQVWVVLFNGAFYATDYDPTQRYSVEQGYLDSLYYVVDTTRMCAYLHETKFHSIARCYRKTDASKIVKALNATKPKTRRKNG